MFTLKINDLKAKLLESPQAAFRGLTDEQQTRVLRVVAKCLNDGELSPVEKALLTKLSKRITREIREGITEAINDYTQKALALLAGGALF